MRQCPHHGLDEWLIPQTFYQGLTEETRNLVIAIAGGNWLEKTPAEANDLLESLASQSYQGDDTFSHSRGASFADTSALSAQIAALTLALSKHGVKLVDHVDASIFCELYGGPHSYFNFLLMLLMMSILCRVIIAFFKVIIGRDSHNIQDVVESFGFIESYFSAKP